MGWVETNGGKQPPVKRGNSMKTVNGLTRNEQKPDLDCKQVSHSEGDESGRNDGTQEKAGRTGAVDA